MNDTTHEQKKNSLLKVLAILGLVGVIILLAWLSTLLVRVLPTAFSSLASLAESVNPSESGTEVRTLIVSSNTTLVTTKEPVTISWSDITAPGHFTFSYQCKDGVAVDLIEVANLESIACDTNYDLGERTTLSFTIDSEKERYVDVSYTVSFFSSNDSTPRASGNAQLTVINSAITGIDSSIVPEESTPLVPPEEEVVVVVTPDPEPTPVPVPVVPPAEEPARPVVPPVVHEPEPIFVIPTSDPNGRTDLGTKFVNVGTIVNNVFVAEPVKRNQAGAIRFEINNYGTKTSGAWNYTVALPDGVTYTAPTQIALKPSERATITLNFPATTVSSHVFSVQVHEASDQNTLNDAFWQKVDFSR